MSKLRVLLKGGYAFGVEADQYVPQKRSGNYGSDIALMSFTKRGDEVCAVLLSELAAIVSEEQLCREPAQMSSGSMMMAPMPSRRRSPSRARPPVRTNGNGRGKQLVRSRR